jgi:maleylpyruvate isomerase
VGVVPLASTGGYLTPDARFAPTAGQPSPEALLAQVEAATGRLAASATGLTDQQAREASLLPGWSRGHLLTHIARNADGLRNLLIWARTGVVTPQYPDAQARDAGIEAGAGRAAAELLADVSASAGLFAAEARSLPAAAWQAQVAGLQGRGHPAWFTLSRRLREVEIHHADLGCGYVPADWPDEFAEVALADVAGDFARPDCPAARLRTTGSGAEYQVGPAGQPPALTITGPASLLLAWLIGRGGAGYGGGDGVIADPAGPLPSPPAW